VWLDIGMDLDVLVDNQFSSVCFFHLTSVT
jgi:hypothetical protein